jgi:hypothetical protein
MALADEQLVTACYLQFASWQMEKSQSHKNWYFYLTSTLQLTRAVWFGYILLSIASTVGHHFVLCIIPFPCMITVLHIYSGYLMFLWCCAVPLTLLPHALHMTCIIVQLCINSLGDFMPLHWYFLVWSLILYYLAINLNLWARFVYLQITKTFCLFSNILCCPVVWHFYYLYISP